MVHLHKIGRKQTGNGVLSFGVDKQGVLFDALSLRLKLKQEYYKHFNNISEDVSDSDLEVDERYNAQNFKKYINEKTFALKIYFGDELVCENVCFLNDYFYNGVRYSKDWGNGIADVQSGWIQREEDFGNLYFFTFDIGFLISTEKLRFEIDFGNDEATKMFDKELFLRWNGEYKNSCFVNHYKSIDNGANKTWFADTFYFRYVGLGSGLTYENLGVKSFIYNDVRVGLQDYFTAFLLDGYKENVFVPISLGMENFVPNKLQMTEVLPIELIGCYKLHNTMTSYLNVLYIEMQKKRIRELQMGTLSDKFTNDFYLEEMPYRLELQGVTLQVMNMGEEYFLKNPVKHKFSE